MSTYFLGVLLVGLVLITTTVGIAEETGASDTLAVNQSGSFSIRSYFASVEHYAAMASEEAFDYLLTGEKTAKDEFYADMNATEEAIDKFETSQATADPYQATFLSRMEDVKIFIPEMRDAAEKMFASYEEKGYPILEDAKAFEESGDDIIYAYDEIWNETTPTQIPPSSYSRERSFFSYLLRAAEESYAYPLTANSSEKEHALANFAEVDKRAARYENSFPNESYEDIKLMKQNLMETAEKMYASYEKDGVVNPEDLKALEIQVEQLDNYYKENYGKLP